MKQGVDLRLKGHLLLSGPFLVLWDSHLLHYLGKQLGSFFEHSAYNILNANLYLWFLFEVVRFFESSIFQLLIKLLNAFIRIQVFALSGHESHLALLIDEFRPRFKCFLLKLINSYEGLLYLSFQFFYFYLFLLQLFLQIRILLLQELYLFKVNFLSTHLTSVETLFLDLQSQEIQLLSNLLLAQLFLSELSKVLISFRHAFFELFIEILAHFVKLVSFLENGLHSSLILVLHIL